MLDMESMHESYKFGQLYDYAKNKYKFALEHPYYFYPDGLTIFTGAQGTGKTLSAVNYAYNVISKYPRCKIVTNIALRDYPIITFSEWKYQNTEYIKKLRGVLPDHQLDEMLEQSYIIENRVFAFDNADDLTRYNNGEYGVLFIIDEIHLYFNSLESKNINIETMVQFAQQRKQRKHIVCTSQVFGRMAKPLREQFNVVIVCDNLLKFIQHNKLVDRDSMDDASSATGTELKGKVKKSFWWLHRYEYYSRYDTYYTISRTKFISAEQKKGEIYGNQLPNNY